MNKIMSSLQLALISGDAVIQSLIYVIIVGVCFGLLWWLLSYIALPAPFDKVARVILTIAAVIILIGVLLGMAGHPLVRW